MREGEERERENGKEKKETDSMERDKNSAQKTTMDSDFIFLKRIKTKKNKKRVKCKEILRDHKRIKRK